DQSKLALGRLHPVRPGDARPRPRRLQPQGARGARARGRGVERGVGVARRAVRRRRLLPHGPAGRAGVRRRLPGRGSALGRQPVRLHPAVLVLQGSGAAAAPRAVLGHPGRAHHARADDRGRRRAHRAVPLDRLRVRRLPGVHRGAHGVPARRAHRPGAQPGAAARAAPGARDLHLPRAEVLRARARRRGRGRAALRHAALRGAAPRRDHRRGVRRGLDPGDLRRHARPVPRVHVERVRDPRAPVAVLPARGHHHEVPLPAVRAVGRARVRGDQDADERGVADPDRRLARGDRAAPRHLDRRVDPPPRPAARRGGGGRPRPCRPRASARGHAAQGL
ncbi:MAG: Integral membrane protein TerC, partial [uncultured Gemmatimonadaceae bacterium]